MLLLIYLEIIFLGFFDVTGTLSIGKYRSPDPSNVDVLQFSTGGADFYERYLYKHKPVIVQGTVKHWPALKHWEEEGYLTKHLQDEDSSIIDSIQKKQYTRINITRSSLLSNDVLLPFALQCEEFVKSISSVTITFNQKPVGNILFSTNEVLLLPLFHTLNIYIFGINKSLSGADLDGEDLRDVDIVKSPQIKDVPYQSYEVRPGDLMYLPKYSWYYLEPEVETLNYLTYNFDVFPFEESLSKKYVEFLGRYKEVLLNFEPTIQCVNNRITIQEILKIDLDNQESIMHLRIPRKNERPDDVVLASGYKMPVLGLGTALLNETTYDAVKYALEVGYRLFDLAYGYPFSEVSFAKAMAESTVPRADVFVVTKLHPRYLGYKETLKAIDLSLENLNTSYIDLYLIHSTECDDFLLACEEDEPKGTWKESWRAMEKARKDGKIRSLGFSNIYHNLIYQLLNWSSEPVSVIQNWFDPFNQDKATREICQEYNIRYMGFSTLGSRWKLLGLEYNPILESDTITGLAGHYDYVVSHVILRWAIHVNVTVIPRSGNPKHISQNYRSLDISLFDVDIEEMNSLESVMKDVLELEEDF